jgi:hypothetical protein
VAVESRYPGDWSDAKEDEACIAVQQARAVWNSVSADFAQRGLDAEHAA